MTKWPLGRNFPFLEKTKNNQESNSLVWNTRLFYVPLLENKRKKKKKDVWKCLTHRRWLYIKKKSNTPKWKMFLKLGFRNLREAVWVQSAHVSHVDYLLLLLHRLPTKWLPILCWMAWTGTSNDWERSFSSMAGRSLACWLSPWRSLVFLLVALTAHFKAIHKWILLQLTLYLSLNGIFYLIKWQKQLLLNIKCLLISLLRHDRN